MGNLTCTQVDFSQLSGTATTGTSFLVYNNQANSFAADDKQSFVAGSDHVPG